MLLQTQYLYTITMTVLNKATHNTDGGSGAHLPYHAKEVQEVLQVLNSNHSGLTSGEVESRYKRYGYNRFTPEKRKSLLARVGAQLASPLALVLVAAFFITLALQEYIDAGVIAFALGIAMVVGVIQEGRASNAFDTLAKSQVKTATVLRDGYKHEVEASSLVPGDIVFLQSGARVPADVRLVTAKQLRANEATLTGEWVAVKKSTDCVEVGASLAEQSSMAWMGTFIEEGYGQGVVVATGDATEVGQLASSMNDTEDAATPLQVEMGKLSHTLVYVIGGLVVLIFAIGVLQGQSLQEMLLISIAIAVASIPEGLPAAVTIVLAVGMEALLKRGGLVRNLLAAETLGSTTYILTDKTGTLTEAKMSITSLLTGDGLFMKKEAFAEHEAHTRHFFEIALAATDAYTDTKGDTTVLRGDSVEQAILQTASKLGIDESSESWRSRREDYLAFTSEQRFAAGLINNDGEYVLCVNGAPSTLLASAGEYLTADGVQPLGAETKAAIEAAITTETEAGRRLVAVGYKSVSYDDIPETDPALIDQLVFVGVVILDDPVRAGIQSSIKGVQASGARVVLITGDNPKTALSIATQVGIAHEHDTVLTGTELKKLSDDELLVALKEITVFARVLPNQKMRIATVLQRKGEVVAMTGDGINDAPALRRANIGVAIGSGTEVAKEASDLVLMQDSFDTIYAAIEEGRRIIANLRKIVGYLLSTSLSEVSLIAAALITGGPAPIVTAQILWGNIIEEGLMSVAFAFEKGEKGAMKRKPQDIHEEGLISPSMFQFMIFTALTLAVLNVSLYLYLRHILALPIEDLRSVMFLAISMDSLFISFAFRSLTVPLWRIPLTTNLFFLASFVVSVCLLLVVLTVPFLQEVMSYEPQPWSLIMLPVVTSVLTLLLIETAKWVFFERRK